MENEVWNLKEIGLNLISNIVCVHASKHMSTQKLEYEIWHKKMRWEFVLNANDVQKCLYLAKNVWDKIRCIITVPHGGHCAQGKERHRKFTYHFFPWITGIETKMLLIILLALIAKLTSVYGDCVVGPQDVKLNWNKVGISVLTKLVYWHN